MEAQVEEELNGNLWCLEIIQAWHTISFNLLWAYKLGDHRIFDKIALLRCPNCACHKATSLGFTIEITLVDETEQYLRNKSETLSEEPKHGLSIKLETTLIGYTEHVCWPNLVRTKTE